MTSEEEKSIPAPLPDIDDEFRAKVNEVYDTWQANKISFADALKLLENLRQEALSENSGLREAAIYNILGIIHGYRGKYEDSIEQFSKARELFDKHGAKRRVASCDLNLGETWRLRANYTRARQYFHSAYEFAKSINDLALQVTALTNEGQVWISLKSNDKARRTLEDALNLSENQWQAETEHDIVRRIDNGCEIHFALSTVYLIEGQALKAWEHAIASLDKAQAIERPVRLGHANRVLGDVITVLGTPPDADFSSDPDTYYQAALDAFRQVKAEGEVGKTLFAQGQSLAKRNKGRSAGQKLQQAMVIFTKLGMTEDAAKAAEAQMSLI